MIPLDFEYVQSHELSEAVEEFSACSKSGKGTLYYAGGTEIITLARIHQLVTDVVIDIKLIPSTRVMIAQNEELILGANLTLTEITDHPLIDESFPLLKVTVNEIADRTARNKITLGGNICGRIFYREAVLPLLVCASTVRIAGPSGLREVPINRVFHQEMRLGPGEFVVQVLTDKRSRTAPYFHHKQRKMGDVGYPVVTGIAIRVEGKVRAAFSGLCPFPFRSVALERELNHRGVPFEQRIDEAIKIIPRSMVLDDYEASRDYRLFVFRSVLHDMLQALGG